MAVKLGISVVLNSAQILLAGLNFGIRDYIFLTILAVVNIPIHIFLAKLMFGGWEGFKEAICFLFTPDIFSIFSGEYIGDRWAEAKLGLFFVLCVLQWFGGLSLVTKLFY